MIGFILGIQRVPWESFSHLAALASGGLLIWFCSLVENSNQKAVTVGVIITNFFKSAVQSADQLTFPVNVQIQIMRYPEVMLKNSDE